MVVVHGVVRKWLPSMATSYKINALIVTARTVEGGILIIIPLTACSKINRLKATVKNIFSVRILKFPTL